MKSCFSNKVSKCNLFDKKITKLFKRLQVIHRITIQKILAPNHSMILRYIQKFKRTKANDL